MLLCDRDIEAALHWGVISIEPYDSQLLQPASIDVRLGRFYRRPAFTTRHIDVASVPEEHTVLYDAAEHDGQIQLAPGEFLLGCTEEVIGLGISYAGRFEGKSSLARLGMAVHVTGGFLDPGFTGQVTVEIANLAPWGLTLRAGMRIGQLAIFELSGMPNRSYAMTGHYQGQRGPTPSRYQCDAPLLEQALARSGKLEVSGAQQ